MAQIEVRVPKLGMDTTEASISAWLVQEGDSVEVGTPLVELETEKVNFTVEAENRGVVIRIIQPREAVVPVGEILALLEPE